MKRRIIKQGHSTHTITLPAKWIQKYRFNAGDEVEMEEQGRNLVISSEKSIASMNSKIDISDLPKFLIKHYIIAVYRNGAEEIELRFNKSLTIDLKTKAKVPTIEVIQETVDELIGVEIIKNTDSSCIIKQLSEISEQEFDNILRRIFLLMTDMSNEIAAGISKKDFCSLKNVNAKFKTIHKFINFCLRVLNKKGHKDYKKTAISYHMISQLNMIAEVYKYLSLEIADEKRIIDEKSLIVIADVNKSLHLLYEIVFKYDQQKILDIIILRRKIFDNINILTKKLNLSDVIMFNRLSVVVVTIMDIAENLVSMQV